MTTAYAILDHKGEFAVAHMGMAKVCGQDGFQTVWVVDVICPNMKLAMEAQVTLVKAALARKKLEEADCKALARRR